MKVRYGFLISQFSRTSKTYLSSLQRGGQYSMTLGLSFTEIARNGVIPRKRRFSNDSVSDQGQARRKIARKDSLTQDFDSHNETPRKDTTLSDLEKLDSTRKQIPSTQSVLLLHGKKLPYTLTPSHNVPQIKNGNDELLIKVQAIGLNPIDWKSPDYGFGIPILPYIAGRDFVGVVVDSSDLSGLKSSRRIKSGDVVLTASTDYRDLRKAAFQEYAVASRYNVCRVPSSFQKDRKDQLAGLGVAFVAAVLTMGVCFGSDFTTLDKSIRGPNLKSLLKEIEKERIPEDVRDECLENISSWERPKAGDWITIWGGSSATSFVIAQLAKLLGLRVIKVVDLRKHGRSLSTGPADLLVDSHDPERAVDIIRGVTENNLHFGVDTIGEQTAEVLQKTLQQWDSQPADDNKNSQRGYSHLVGLNGFPKTPAFGVKYHTVPIKVHHDMEEIGEALMTWLEVLLDAGQLVPPEAIIVKGGLERVNASLDKMRRGEVSGKRLIVKLS